MPGSAGRGPMSTNPVYNPCPFCGKKAGPLVLCDECEALAVALRMRQGLPIRNPNDRNDSGSGRPDD